MCILIIKFIYLFINMQVTNDINHIITNSQRVLCIASSQNRRVKCCIISATRNDRRLKMFIYVYLLIQTAASRVTASPGASQSGNSGSNT